MLQNFCSHAGHASAFSHQQLTSHSCLSSSNQFVLTSTSSYNKILAALQQPALSTPINTLH